MVRSCHGAVQPLRSEALPKRYVADPRSIRGATDDRPEQDDPRPGGHRESSAPRPSWPPRRLAGVTVLVVDDDESSLDYFALALRAAGAVVTTASTALDGLKLVQEQRPAVVLSDIAMPDRDGFWLVREIRGLADPVARGVPVVATTAYGRVDSRERTLAAGFVEHLPKPVEPEHLWATIARAAGR